MATIQIELPDDTAEAARKAGLLTPVALDQLLTNTLKRQEAMDRLLTIAAEIATAGIEPVSMEEIDVKTVRRDDRLS